MGAVIFTALICLKHLFIVFAPILGLFTLVSIFSNQNSFLFELLLIFYSCSKILIMSFLPFIMNGQIFDIAKRLFPIQRGLLHSYWAPNFWALYSIFDLTLRRLFIIKPELYVSIFKKNEIPDSNLCNGLTGEKSFSILPNIYPYFTVLLIGILHIVCCIVFYFIVFIYFILF